MITSSTRNKHLTQVAYKIVFLVFVLSLLTFVFLTIPDSGNKILYELISVVLVGVLFYYSYRQDLLALSEEINYAISENNTFASIVNTAFSAMLITDGEGISYHNKAAQQLFKKSVRFMSTCRLSDLIYPADYPAIMEYINQGLEADSLVLRTNTFNHYDSECLYCQVSLKKHFFEHRQQYIVNMLDVTEYFADSSYKTQTMSLYENVFRAMPQSISLFDTTGRLLFSNRALKDNNRESTFLDLIEFDINKNLLKTGFEVALAGDTFTDSRVVTRTLSEADGRHTTEEWGEIRLMPVHSDDRTGYVAYMINGITELKTEITELDAKVKIYAAEFNKTYFATILWDIYGNFLQANDAFYQLFGTNENSIRKLNPALASDQLQDFFIFNEVIFLDENKKQDNKYALNSLAVGVHKFFERMHAAQDFDAYICLDPRSQVFNMLKDSPEAGLASSSIVKRWSTESEMWLSAHVHSLIDVNGNFYATAINFLDISDYMEAQRRHNINVTYLRAIANNFYAGIIFIVNAEYQIVFWGGEDKLKQKININSDMWSRHYMPLFNVPELEQHKNHIDSSFRGSYSKTTINLFDIVYDFQFSPIRNENGDVEFCMGIGFNITERAEFEKQLLLQKYFLDKIFAESQVPQVILDSNGKIDRANIQYYQITGLSPDKLHETSVYNKHSWLNKEIIISNFERTLQGQTTHFEITEKKTFNMLEEEEEEEYLYVLSCKSYPILDNNNVVTHVIFNFIDISDTRMLIESMRKYNTINAMVTANYPEGILIILDKNQNFVLFEGKDELEMLNIQSSSIVGRNINNIKGIQIIDIIKPYFENMCRSLKSDIKMEHKSDYKINFDFSFELIQDDKFPTTLFYEATMIPIWDLNDAVENMFVCVNNITNRKQLEKTILDFNVTLEQEVVQRTAELEATTQNLETYVNELQTTQNKLLAAQQELSVNLHRELELNQMKSRFISLMSHEFRTPLTIIQTSLYLMDVHYEMRDKAKFDKGVDTITSSIDTITNLLDNILFLDKANDTTLSFSTLDMVSLIKGAVQEAVQTNRAEQTINITSESESISMITDANLVQKIVTNIVTNSIKYTPKSSEININILDRSREVEIIIQDFGNGISDDVRDKIFSTFVRSQDFTNISGAGLGLAITKNSVDILKGSIRFETETGEGTTFYVVIPKPTDYNNDTYGNPEAGGRGTVLKNINYNDLANNDDFIISDTGIIIK